MLLLNVNPDYEDDVYSLGKLQFALEMGERER